MPFKCNKSPAWEKPKDIMKRHLMKRKSSKNFTANELSHSGLDSVKEFTSDNSKFFVCEDSQSQLNESNPFRNILNSPGTSKRKCSEFSDDLSTDELKLINWNDETTKRVKNSANFCQSENNSTIDWDDTTARSSFDCSFVRKSSTFINKGNGSFEDQLSQTINDSYPIDFSHFTSLCSSTPKIETNLLKKSSSEFPIDMRIGNKIRIVSQKPFPWLSKCTAVGTYSVKLSSEDISAAMKLSMNGYAESEKFCEFFPKTPLAVMQAAAMFYQSLNPFAKSIFPRLEGTFSNQRATKSVMEFAVDWIESFEHLCSTWRNKQRNYFYVCTHSFTALFTHSTKQCAESDELIKSNKDPLTNANNEKEKNEILSNSSDHSTHYPTNLSTSGCIVSNTIKESLNNSSTCKIVLTPTTLGLRESLASEGIRFSLPLRMNKMFVNFAEEESVKDFIEPSNQKDEELLDLDEDEWLKEIGISPKSTLRFSQNDFSKELIEADDVETDNDKLLSTDSRLNSTNEAGDVLLQGKRKGAETSSEEARRSTIVIADSKSINAFCKMLSLFKIGVSRNGIYAGFPPTLLAASPFFGCFSKKLRMNSQITKKNGVLRYVLELTDGPILPMVSKMLVEFLKNTNSASSSKEKSAVSFEESNFAQIQVLGRLPYTGINEAIDSQKMMNINEFKIDFLSDTFSW